VFSDIEENDTGINCSHGDHHANEREAGTMPGTDIRPITAAVDIALSPSQVFAYVTDPSHLPEWQVDVRRASFDEPATVGVGARGQEVRHVMGADRPITWEVTDYDPHRRYGVRGIDGPVRAHVMIDLTPNTDGTRTHLEYGIDFEGHGIGKLIAPVARKGARKDLATTLDRLRARLEGAR
jgi:uncharacterized protein YndB with AHSA1/START domain